VISAKGLILWHYIGEKESSPGGTRTPDTRIRNPMGLGSKYLRMNYLWSAGRRRWPNYWQVFPVSGLKPIHLLDCPKPSFQLDNTIGLFVYARVLSSGFLGSSAGLVGTSSILEPAYGYSLPQSKQHRLGLQPGRGRDCQHRSRVAPRNLCPKPKPCRSPSR